MALLHLFYRVDRRGWRAFRSRREPRVARNSLASSIGPPATPEQLQCFAIPGHKADFGVMIAGTDLKAVHGIQVAIQASAFGPALEAAYSFYSLTEVSEYVPDAEEYGRILGEREGVDPESSVYKTKVVSYAERLAPMNRQRFYPDFPDWPCLCFYPMSKMRHGEQNWYLLPFEERAELMSRAWSKRHEIRW